MYCNTREIHPVPRAHYSQDDAYCENILPLTLGKKEQIGRGSMHMCVRETEKMHTQKGMEGSLL